MLVNIPNRTFKIDETNVQRVFALFTNDVELNWIALACDDYDPWEYQQDNVERIEMKTDERSIFALRHTINRILDFARSCWGNRNNTHSKYLAFYDSHKQEVADMIEHMEQQGYQLDESIKRCDLIIMEEFTKICIIDHLVQWQAHKLFVALDQLERELNPPERYGEDEEW